MRIWSEVDPFTQAVVAWHTTLRFMLPQRTIYMDGRPHPSENAPHTWQGFSTGEWEGDMLKVTTTHLKEGWIRRNGLARSEKATLIEYFIRHGDFFTLVSDVKDPVYLTEPFIRTATGSWTWGPAPLPSEFMHSQCRGPSSGRLCRAPLARGESVADRVCVQVGNTSRGGSRRRGDDVSRVSREVGENARAAQTSRAQRDETMNRNVADLCECFAGGARADRWVFLSWRSGSFCAAETMVNNRPKAAVSRIRRWRRESRAAARAGERLHDRRRGREHHRASGRSICDRRGRRGPTEERRSPGGDPERDGQAHPFHHRYQR